MNFFISIMKELLKTLMNQALNIQKSHEKTKSNKTTKSKRVNRTKLNQVNKSKETKGKKYV